MLWICFVLNIAYCGTSETNKSGVQMQARFWVNRGVQMATNGSTVKLVIWLSNYTKTNIIIQGWCAGGKEIWYDDARKGIQKDENLTQGYFGNLIIKYYKEDRFVKQDTRLFPVTVSSMPPSCYVQMVVETDLPKESGKFRVVVSAEYHGQQRYNAIFSGPDRKVNLEELEPAELFIEVK